MIGHDHLWEKITIYRKTGTNANGQPTYGAAVQTTAFITRKTKTLKRKEGTDIQSTAQVTLGPGYPISNLDKIVLPEGTTLEVQEASPVYQDYGCLSHWVAYL